MLLPNVCAACTRVATIWDDVYEELPKIFIRLLGLQPAKFEVLRAAWEPFIEAGDLVGEKALLGALLLDGDFGLERDGTKPDNTKDRKGVQAFFAGMFGGWRSETPHLKDE